MFLSVTEANTTLPHTRQGEDEEDNSYSICFHNSLKICGNVHSSNELTTYYIDGIRESIRTLFSRYHETERHSTYLEFLNYAKVEVDIAFSSEKERFK